MPGKEKFWPDQTSIKAVVLDFDKTITIKHTRGVVFQPSQLEHDNIEANFVDIDFFRRMVEGVRKAAPDVKLCIATFADEEEEALCSGKALVREYLEVAFPEKSREYFPDDHIQAFNPENQDLDARKVGKSLHLDALRKLFKLKKKEMILFDDSDRNCILARKLGYHAISIDAPTVEEPETEDGDAGKKDSNDDDNDDDDDDDDDDEGNDDDGDDVGDEEKKKKKEEEAKPIVKGGLNREVWDKFLDMDTKGNGGGCSLQ